MNFNLKLFNTTETELESHCCTRQHRIQQQSVYREQNARSQWDTDYIIYKCQNKF